jgi:hypothetical protein
MEQTVFDLIGKLGVPAAVLAFLVAVWAQIKPTLVRLLEEQTARISNQNLREIALGVVKAMEQVYGPQSEAPNEAAAKQLGLGKLERAQRETSQQAGVAVPAAVIEAAVYDMKAERNALAGLSEALPPPEPVRLVGQAAPVNPGMAASAGTPEDFSQN